MRAIVKGFVIGVLGLAGLLVPVGNAYALDNKESCAQGGWVLCKNGKCGTNHCTCAGKTLQPGDICTKERDGKPQHFYCDGCSGNMVQGITGQPKALPQLKQSTPLRPVTPPAGGTPQKSP